MNFTNYISRTLRESEDYINSKLNQEEVDIAFVGYTFQMTPWKDEVEMQIVLEEEQYQYEVCVFVRSATCTDEDRREDLVREIIGLNKLMRGKFNEEHLHEHLEEIRDYVMNEMGFEYLRFTVSSNMSLEEVKVNE